MPYKGRKEYVPLRGTLQRRRAIRRKINNKPDPTVRHSGRDWTMREMRRTAGKMFGFTPMTRLSLNEMHLMKGYARYFLNNVFLQLYANYDFRKKPSEYPNRWRSEGVDRYQDDGEIPVYSTVQKAVNRKRGPVRIMDVGAESGQMLSDLKEKFGDSIETHALSPSDVPRFPVDEYHMVFGEYMPNSFRGKFDFIMRKRHH